MAVNHHHYHNFTTTNNQQSTKKKKKNVANKKKILELKFKNVNSVNRRREEIVRKSNKSRRSKINTKQKNKKKFRVCYSPPNSTQPNLTQQ